MNRLPLFLSAIILAAPSSLLADEPPSDHRPVISPDGNSVVFMSTREGGDWELFSVKLDGTRLKRLTHNIGWDGYAV